MMIELPIWLQYNQRWEIVIALVIPDMAPHLAHIATFALFRETRGNCYWNVTNIETGCAVTTGRLRRQAILMARVILSRVTPKRQLAAYANLPRECRT